MSGAPSEEHRCTAMSRRSGQRCGAWAMRGSDVCRMHGGSAGQVRRASEVRAAKMDAEAEAQRMVDRAGVEAHPIEHLLESLHRSAALVEIYGRMVADLDNQGEVEAHAEPGRVRGWAERTVEIGDDGKGRTSLAMDPLMVATSDKTVQLHPFVREYHEAIERRAKMAKLCLEAGVEERRTRIVEEQAAQVAQLIHNCLSDLGVADHPEAARVVRRHLTAMGSGQEAG